jgi:hypothetical protein
MYMQNGSVSVFEMVVRIPWSGKDRDRWTADPYGVLSESLVTLSARVYAQGAEANVKHLHWLRDELGDDLLDAVVVNTGPNAYRRPDGIAVVPAALLGE